MIETLVRSLFVVALAAGAARAQEADVRLAVPDALEQSGFMQYLVPRFSLKTSIRIERVGAGDAAEMQFGPEGTAVFMGLGETWSLSHDGDARAERFLDWLTSEISHPAEVVLPSEEREVESLVALVSDPVVVDVILDVVVSVKGLAAGLILGLEQSQSRLQECDFGLQILGADGTLVLCGVEFCVEKESQKQKRVRKGGKTKTS